MKTLQFALLAAAASAVLAAPALADTATYTLDATNITVAPGGTYALSGTISVTGTGTYYIGDSLSGDSPIMLDDTALNTDTPYPLDATTPYSGPLFSIFAPAGTVAGSYVENFTVLFYTDPTGGTPAFEEEQSVTVNVGSAASVTPEPGSWVLLTTGLAGVGMLRRRLSAARA